MAAPDINNNVIIVVSPQATLGLYNLHMNTNHKYVLLQE